MFYRLKEQFRLRGWEKLPWGIEDRKLHTSTYITKRQMEALKLCNGKIDLDLPLIAADIRKMIPELEKEGLIERCEAGETILPIQEYKKYPCRYMYRALWSLTGRCNYRCKHCYMSAPDAKYGELDHETMLKLAREIGDCGIVEVSLTGGEPLVRDDFFEIVDALLEKEVWISQIYSNGELVNEKLLKALDDRGIHPEFNMSFDGVGWHDWMRGIPGAEASVDRAFRLCKEMGFPTGAEMCIHKQNKDTLRETINYLSSVGCTALKTNPVSNTGEWRINNYGESISIDELFQTYLDYIPYYYEDGMPLALMLGGFFSARPKRPDYYDIPLYHYPKDPDKCVVCAHARTVMYISPEGRALPCMSLTASPVQDDFPLIPELGLTKCITDSVYMDFITTRAAKVLEHNEECRSCEYRRWCQGGCRASGLADSPSYDDLLYRDLPCCALYRDGWIPRIMRLMKELKPDADSALLKDEYWKEQIDR